MSSFEQVYVLWYNCACMELKTVRDAGSLRGKNVLLRVAYDVPLQKRGSGYVVSDSRRIVQTLPTIEYLLKAGAKVTLLTWLNRPQGKVVEKYRLDPIARSLSKLVKKPVKKINDCIGPVAAHAVSGLKNGSLLLLENVRFHRAEEVNDRHFARLLVHGQDLIVFDAFAQAHRVHASTVGITKLLPTYAGMLLTKELAALDAVRTRPKQPLVIIIGGAKISDKIATLEHLLPTAEAVLIGGGVANVFLKASGVAVGQSFIEDVFVDSARRRKQNVVRLAKRLLKRWGKKIIIPQDLIAANSIDQHAVTELIDLTIGDRIDKRWKFLDIGPRTVATFLSHIKSAKTIFWNGPMGVFEINLFSFGTKKIASAVARSQAVSVIGGGDTEVVATAYGLENAFTHVSTGGGASLEYLAAGKLPALEHILVKRSEKKR